MRLLLFLSVLPAIAAATGYTTYISGTFPEQVNAMAVDSGGNTYLTGARTIVPNNATTGAAALTDVFVTKLDVSGNLVATFTLSGKGSDQGNGIAVDSAGNIWVTGTTTSPDFPLLNPLQSSIAMWFGEQPTGFLTKLAPDGSMLFSTYLGGTMDYSGMNAVAVDANGNAYVTGVTTAPDYPHTAGLPAGTAIRSEIGFIAAGFFAKISAAGDKMVYAGGVPAGGWDCGSGSTCFLSSLSASGNSIAVDPSGSAYIAGNTNGTELSTTPGALVPNGVGAYIMKVNPSGSGLVYLTMLGSANYIPPGVSPNSNAGNTVTAIAADAAGNAYITGYTSDPAFPATSGVVQPVYSIPASQIQVDPYVSPPPDTFAAKLNPQGTAMVWASFLGGTEADRGHAIAVDASGDVWVSGTTSSTNFPVSSGFPQGPEFIAEFNSTGSALSYGERFPADTVAAAIAIDASGAVHAAGAAGLVTEIIPAQSSGPYLFGIANAAGGVISGRLAPSEVISIYGATFGVSTPIQGSFNSAGILSNNLGGVQVMIGGVPAPLLYVSNTQINAVAPAELTAGSTEVVVTIGSTSLPGFRAQVDQSDPQVFLNADGSAAAINQDGSVNSAANPAAAGSIVSIWATGTGAEGPDGLKATTPVFSCSCGIGSLSVTYAGYAPGLVDGVTQINFQIPASANAGPMEYFSLTAGSGIGSRTFVYVSP